MTKKIPSFILILSVMLLAGCKISPKNLADKNPDSTMSASFAECLTNKGMRMFGTQWCSFCKKQKALFGESFGKIAYIDCDQKKAACEQAQITGYPTWILQDKKYPGIKTLENLAKISGCILPDSKDEQDATETNTPTSKN